MGQSSYNNRIKKQNKMKKFFTVLMVFFLVSCAVQKKTTKDPYVGIYDITVFDVTQIGDVPLKLTINKSGSSYTSNIEGRAEAADNGTTWEIDSTTVEDGVVTIEAYVANYDVYFELNIDGEDISGSLMGMFDVEGVRVESP